METLDGMPIVGPVPIRYNKNIHPKITKIYQQPRTSRRLYFRASDQFRSRDPRDCYIVKGGGRILEAPLTRQLPYCKCASKAADVMKGNVSVYAQTIYVPHASILSFCNSH